MNVRCSATPCPVVLDALCVRYEGPNLICSGINTNDNLDIVIQKLDAKYNAAISEYNDFM